MLIVGAKGFAKEVLEVLHQQSIKEEIAFFDNVTPDISDKLYNSFRVLKSFEEVQDFFVSYGHSFTLGVGGVGARLTLYKMFSERNGEFTSTISPHAHIGHFNNYIGNGVNIMTGTVITNDVSIGDGTLINLNCTIGHDTVIGNFCELSPGVHISGNCVIGDFCSIGTGSVILPKVRLGSNVIVGAGAVVTKDVENNTLVVGVPAKEVKKLLPL